MKAGLTLAAVVALFAPMASAYNAGPGNLRKFREKAKTMGLDPNVWFGNVENGAAAIVGRETVQYVSNIYKYYVAYSLLVDRMAERKQVGLPQAD